MMDSYSSVNSLSEHSNGVENSYVGPRHSGVLRISMSYGEPLNVSMRVRFFCICVVC